MSSTITTKDIAEHLNISKQTVRNWTRIFDIPHKRNNGIRYEPDILEVFKIVSSLRDTSGDETIKKQISGSFACTTPAQRSQNDGKMEQIESKIISTIKESNELAEKYARATYTIGQLEAEKRALELQVQELSEKIKLLPNSSEHNNLKKELELIKRPLWKKFLSLFTNR